MSAFDYQKSTLTKYRSGASNDPYIDITESKRIMNGVIQLSEIPVVLNKVRITNYFEVPNSNIKKLNNNEYRVDYTEGIVSFSSSEEGKEVTVIYKGRGNHYVSAARVWIKENNGKVIETLQGLVDTGNEAAEQIKDLTEVIDDVKLATLDTKQATVNAENAAIKANIQASYAKEQGEHANTQGDYAKIQGDYAKELGEYAKIQGEYAKIQGDYVKSATTNTLIATENAIIATSNANQAANIVEIAKNSALEATENANSAALSAETQANYAKTQGDYAKDQGTLTEELIPVLENAIESANTTTSNMLNVIDDAVEAVTSTNTQANYAKTQGDYAREQGDNAKEQASQIQALEQTIVNSIQEAQTATQVANQAIQEMNELIDDSQTVINSASLAANLANTQANYAKEQGDYAKELGIEASQQALSTKAQALYAKEQGDYAKEQGGYAHDVGTSLINKGPYDEAITYKPLNIVAYNNGVYQNIKESIGILPTDTEYWQLLLETSVSATWASISGKPTSTVENIDDAVTKKHAHSNQEVIDATTASYTTELDTKLAGIATGANVVASSMTNGNLNIDGTDTVVYAHPTGDGNLHVPPTRGELSTDKFLKAGDSPGIMGWSKVFWTDLAGEMPTNLETTSGSQAKADSVESIAKNYTDGKTGVLSHLQTDDKTNLVAAINENFQVNTDHTSRKDNPHEVDKLQVGLGSVENYPIATQEQAEDGTEASTYMTPLRTKEAIGKLSATRHGTGLSSVVEGQNTIASGDYSHAEGCQTEAYGAFSHVEGELSKANGRAAHAEGYRTLASGQYAHSEGNDTIAQGSSSHAEGQLTRAYGVSSHAEGEYTFASSRGSHAEGMYSVASEVRYIGEITSFDTTTKTVTVLYGPGTLPNVGDTIYVSQANNGAILSDGLAAKSTAEVSGYYVLTFTTLTPTANWKYVIAANTSASQSPHAEGCGTLAIGANSHAEGFATYAYGESSHVQGDRTSATGLCSQAGGRLTKANTYLSNVFGIFNKRLNGGGNVISVPQDVFVIGNGTAAGMESNAFRITLQGDIYGIKAYNSSGADYAEFFEWEDKNTKHEDRVGYFVTLSEEFIRKARATDNYVLGVISATPGVVGDSQSEDWVNRYVKDEWGRVEYEEVIVPARTYLDEEHNELVLEEEQVSTLPKINSEWDNTREYIPRENRPEWSYVGLMGKLLVRDNGQCEPGGYCYPNDDGIAVPELNEVKGFRVMKRTSRNIIQIVLK
ncbi:hypothetical protein D3C76_279600 [compost metagenome]